MVGASLETVGYYYQSLILDVIAGPLQTSVAGLFFVVGALVALSSFVALGSFRLGAWFFLGPGIFLMVLGSRTETTGANWKFGGDQRDIQAVRNGVEDVIGGDLGELETEADEEPARVATLFAWYNKLVSASVQEIVRVLAAERAANKADLKFIVRSQMLSELYAATPLNRDFEELLHNGLLRQCGQAVDKGRDLRDPKYFDEEEDVLDKDKHDKLRKQFFALMNKPVTLTPGGVRYLAALKTDHPVWWKHGISKADSPDVSKWLRDIDKDLKKKFDGPLTPDGRPANWRAKYEKAKDEVEQARFTCFNIWRFIYLGLHRAAKEKVNGSLRGLPKEIRESVLQDLSKSTGWDGKVDDHEELTDNLEQLDHLYKAIAKYMLRNVVAKENVGAFLSDYARRGQSVQAIEVPSGNDLSFTEQAIVENQEWKEKSSLMTSASNMPYYQGLGLCFLAIVFPFFALLLIVPGKHAGFLLWFSLWMWLKSWDIGFAIVMAIDDVLYELFSKTYEPGAGAPATTLDVDLSSAIMSLAELDPSFQLATYYKVLGTAIHSIPIVTSYLILGSLRGGSGLISAGIQKYASFVSTGLLAGQGQQGITGVRSAVMAQQGQRARNYLNNQKQSGNASAGYSDATQQGMSGTPIHRQGPTLGLSGNAKQTGARWAGYIGGAMDGFSGKTVAAEKYLKDDNTPAAGGNGRGSGGARRVAQNRSKPGGGLKKGRGIARIARDVSGVLSSPAHFAKGSLLRLRNLETDAARSWAMYDSINSQSGQTLAALGRIYGMFEIPWTEEGGWDEELALEIGKVTEVVKGGQEVYKLVDNTVNKVRPLVKKHNRDKARANRNSSGSGSNRGNSSGGGSGRGGSSGGGSNRA